MTGEMEPDVEVLPIGSIEARLIALGDRVVLHRRSGHGYESDTLAVWSEICRGGGTILDIGAYTGIFSIVAALSGCRALAFEPVPFNAQRLRENARLNGVTVELIEAAVTDRLGTVAITYKTKVPFTTGASIFSRKRVADYFSGRRKTIRVPSITVDSLVLPQLTAMKLDIERAEPLALAGARTTIDRCQPIILTEILDADQREKIAGALPRYEIARELDGRNALLVPRR